MTDNRRNYYRILQVQPEAPAAVIKASWRALMQGARMHPDLGGDPVAAALINEAYTVLGDPERRRAYDRQLDLTRLRGGTAGAARGPAAARAAPPGASPPRAGETATGAPGAQRTSPPRHDPSAWRTDRTCPLCRHALPVAMRPDSRCSRCDAPLWPAPRAEANERELFGRRTSARRPRTDDATLHPDWRGSGIAARLVDLSVGGAALVSAAPVASGTAVRVITGSLDAVARVVDCHRLQQHWRVRVQWLTARPLGRRGVHVSLSA